MAMTAYPTKKEKLAALKIIADTAVKNVSRDKTNWREFLRFYSGFYKYSFSEALLIHEQAPGATACGEIQHWNKVGRRVHKGTNGIPIINMADRSMDIHYVFDVSDTYGEDHGIPRKWALPDKYRYAVLTELQKRFTVEPPTQNYEKNIKWAVEEYVRESCLDHLDGIQYDTEGSFMEELDMDNIRKEFIDTVVDSVGYLVCERLNIEKGLYDDDELAFQFLYDFNNKPLMSRVGAAVNHISYNVLTLVSQTIRQEISKERVNINERTGNELRGSQEDFGNDGGGSRSAGSRPGGERKRTDIGEIRPAGEGLPQGISSGEIRVSSDGDDADGRSYASGQRRARDDGSGADETAERNAAPEGKLHGGGAVRNGDTRRSGGNRAERNNIQTTVVTEAESKNSPLFASSERIENNNIQQSVFDLPVQELEMKDEETSIITHEKSTEKTIPTPKPPNYHFSPEDGIGAGGAKTKYKNNIEAIKLMQTIESENRYAAPDEQRVLARYAGWGGISQVFDENNSAWRDEYDELKNLLSEKEYEAARSSTLNAHYTSIEVIDGIYKGLDRLGFKGGSVLEPALGVGNFFAAMPPELAEKSRLYATELDSATGRIARQLYPNADIRVQGYETADLPDNFFDAAVSNVPFGAYKLNDPKFDKYNLLIHDYFFCKTLDKIRPGGVVAFITSKGTMDKANTTVRRYIAERAEFLGAVRLPNTAFKANAGTEVTTDIIFLKKRGYIMDASNESWIHTGKTADGVPVNEYYLDNPHMMLGTMAFDSSMYGNEAETTLNTDGRDIHAALTDAVEYLPKNAITAAVADITELDGEDSRIPADPSVKNFCYTIVDGEIFQRINSTMEKREFPKAAVSRVTAMIEMRRLTRDILDMQLDGCTDEDLRWKQDELNGKYDYFFKRYGAINSRYNNSLFGDDADYPLLSAIEEIDDEGGTTKADIFTKRTIAQTVQPNHADTAIEALPICLNQRGYIDIRYISELTEKPAEKIVDDLRGIIFRNPVYNDPDKSDNLFVGWETADEYLSGNVREKLSAAERASQNNPAFAVNVEALKAVQPKPLEAHEISARIGASWIDPSYYRRFLLEKLKPPGYEHDRVVVHYTAKTGQWTVEKPYSRNKSIEATKEYGTDRMDAYELMEVTLNQKSAKIYDRVTDAHGNEKSVLNQKATVAIREKQSRLKEEFKRWIFDEPERRERLCGVYNNLFNSEQLRTYNGSHLTFPGMSPEITLRQHQRDAIARILYGGNTLLAHQVGAGKTYTMAAAAMEMKRLGIAQKCCFVVPNHLVGQWTNEFQRLYPTANILAATKKDFEKQNRQRFCARIATGEWDAVIIGHSSFEKVPVSLERQQAKIEREIDEIRSAIIEAKSQKGENITVKELERALRGREYDLKKLLESPKDNLVNFEQLGVDALFVDEAHSFKNKFIFTKMNNVAGLSKARAKKSTDMDMKCEYINEYNNASRGVIFATGTPVSNSMVELYTMQTYLQRDELEHMGLNHFDNWSADFGEVVAALELAPSGQGYRIKERFAKFVNLPELMKMYRKVADIQTAEMLKLPVPEVAGGKAVTISVDPSPELKAFTDKLVERAEKIHNREVQPEEDNMLCVTSDGRNAALDMRCVDPTAPDYPDSKVNTCVQKVFEIYKSTAENKLTQMIFSDLSTPKGGKQFSIYDDIKAKLIELGVKESEVTFIHDAKTDEQKEKMFSAVRRGDIRILMGSTQKMGAGTNCQTRLAALHHLDCPYRPADLQQREGRIVRQGNMNPEVQIYNYVTKQSFDSYLWQIVESKQKFISQVMSGKNPSRSMDDIDETVLNYAEVKAIATGNPLIRRKMELDLELQRLRILESQYRADRYNLEDSVLKRYPAQIAGIEQRVRGLEFDIARRNNSNGGDEFSITLGRKTFSERKDAGELLLKAVASGNYADKTIGLYNGFEIVAQPKIMITDTHVVLLKGELTYRVELSDSDVGSIARIENAVRALDKNLADNRRELSEAQQRMESAKQQIQRPFDQEDALQMTLQELVEVNAALDVDKSDDANAVLSEKAEGDDVLELDEENGDVTVEDEREEE